MEQFFLYKIVWKQQDSKVVPEEGKKISNGKVIHFLTDGKVLCNYNLFLLMFTL